MNKSQIHLEVTGEEPNGTGRLQAKLYGQCSDCHRNPHACGMLVNPTHVWEACADVLQVINIY